jgi:5'-phosphate synthase pdxT subunit
VKVGVLALQGAFAAHAEVLASLGAAPVEIRQPSQLEDVDALVLPGGESTTMSKLAEGNGFLQPLRDFVGSGRPTLGTCAGAILLASEIQDGRPDQHCLGSLDMVVRRNAFGTQRESFETDLVVEGLVDGRPGVLRAVFIRAPQIVSVGQNVEVLASVDRSPALVRSSSVLVSTFHPELSGDFRLHEMFLSIPRGS